MVLMAKNVSALHGRLVAVQQMEVRAANRAGGDLDDHIARVLDYGIGNGVNADIALPVPAECAHRSISAQVTTCNLGIG
jgi:hypothetical protein